MRELAASQLARAKINLTLHVGRVIRDADRFHGYHPLDSLVVFADVGDRLAFAPADAPSLEVAGPFGEGLEAGEDNLVMRALHAANRVEPGSGDLFVTLEKTLPLSSGIGGGSADAAAVLRATLAEREELIATALRLGSDVPVCVASRTQRMTGIGETLTPEPGLGSVAAVLVNPGVAVSTGEVFRRFDAGDPRGTPRPQAASGTLLARARDGRNDLQPIAVEMEPVIGEVIAAVEAQAGCQLTRMSGSGATVFGLFDSDAEAQAAADTLSRPGWWSVACRLGDSPA